ncbi:hypothetical protein [Dermatophilus congolensis]|uniref:Polyketide cyclase / dehydrase and lipid transport n=1 Tax=Dermatophilus congolensis TaxID=1863 RepID=A0A239VC54_9MICO|nr:hypothetical protein [Dermatophilus congolensis]MBO3128498.1 dimethyladenosine transferase [Dermatophilus congolensis]MBO3132865.1 dimethyladenosine transferase [Dermatophilus congolensis]MBO3132975.1 dimethyladenosine transferase [Dermatophilus congolensis]MBO3135212.1 dimethyladenosine transferase [Dermatophilus congolensis]MBO3137449.1 dimethyladenosine transferase [Dermatophilus congolensis]
MNIHDIETIDCPSHQVAKRALINAPAHSLFEMIANPHRHHEFDGSGTVQPTVIGPRELHLGDRFTVAMRLGPIRYKITSTATEITTDRVIEWRHPGGHHWRYDLDPVDATTTLLTETFRYDNTHLPTFYELLRIPQRNSRSIHHTLATIQTMHNN